MQTKLKYCGNHSLEDVRTVALANADYIGFVFANSKRKVSANDVRRWLEEMNDRGPKVVALFVNAAIQEIEKVIQVLSVDIVQCHGTETPEEIQQLQQNLNKPIWKVIHHEQDAWRKMEDYAPYVEAFIIDSKVKGQWGGTGTTFDWSHIPHYINQGKLLNRPVFIAGGINPTNVEQLLVYEPDGIDISSGIEQNGRKNKNLMNKIEERITEYERKLSR